MEPCLICKITAKEIPSTVVYEDDSVLAFLDIHPVNIGHTLVVPKVHYRDLYELPDETLEKIAVVVKKLASAVKAGVTADGINIAMNNGTAAGQVIDHAHFHIIPRHNGDGFAHWKGVRGYEEGEKDMIAKKIKTFLISA